MDNIVGRKEEVGRLDSIIASKEAEFVVVYGRRRIGKTYLVNTYFDENFAFKLTGLAQKSKKEQLSNFATSLNRYGSAKFRKPRTWYEAFESLRLLLESKPEKSGKRVVFIDELPWMDSRGGNLVPAIEHFWNDWACTQSNLVFIVCGSATSWMTKKILKNRGGLHNRVTQKIYLHPFTLAECKEYVSSQGILMDDKSIAECYMIMGGVPYYLKQLQKGKSLAQNVDDLFFKEKGALDGEFDALYASLFDKSENYIKVVEALSSKRKGLTRTEILHTTKMTDNGHFSTILKNLVDCDFVRYYKGYEKTAKAGMYQLIDPFTLFYYNFIQKYGTSDKPFWQFQQGTRTHDTWAGLAFEQLCLNHHRQIEAKLGISGILTQTFSWTAPADSEERAQIDLIIKRADNVVNVCEMKYSGDFYSVSKKDAEDMERKIRAFKSANKTKYPVLPVLITTYGIKQNIHSDTFQNIVILSDLFNC